MKPIILAFAVMLFIITGCADDSTDDISNIAWTQIFSDDFARSDTNSGSTDSLGSNYRTFGTMQITSNEVISNTSGRAEYQTPLTKKKAKLTIKFSSDTFSLTAQHGILLQDAVSSPGGCQVAVGYLSDGTNYSLYVLDKDAPTTPLASASATLSTDTQYTLEMIINQGAVTGTITNSSGETLATTTASTTASSSKYVDCLIQEPAFSMDLTGTVTFDDFTISTAD